MTKSLQFFPFGRLVELDTSDRPEVCFIRLMYGTCITGLTGGSLASKAHPVRHFKVLLQGDWYPALTRSLDLADLTYRKLILPSDGALDAP